MNSPAPIFHRIHPLTVIIELPKALRQLLFVIVIVVLQMMRGGVDGETQFELWAAVLGLLVVFPGIARYYSFGYAIHNGNLLIRSGIVTKKLRTIPLSRIQNINLSKPFLHRLLGLVDLQIETAVGGAAEAEISALSEEKARILKAQLSGDRPRAYSPIVEERNKTVVYRPTLRELILVGASENRAGAIFAAIAGLAVLPPVMNEFIGDASRESFSRVQEFASKNVLVSAIAFVGFLLIGWLVSIVSTVTRYYNFEILQEGANLRRHFGLFTQIENVLPLNRVQTIRVRQNFVQRWLKICQVYASTAGGFSGKQDGQQQSEVQRTPLLSPVVRDTERDRLLQVLRPDLDLHRSDWQSVSAKTLWRHFRSSLIPSAVAAGSTAYWLKWMAIPVFVGFVLIGVLSGFAFYKTARWSSVTGFIAFKAGWPSKRWQFVPGDKIQYTSMSQTPVQRALKLGSVRFNTAATFDSSLEIEDLSFEDAKSLAFEFHRRSMDTKDSLVDGH
ncbi:PH domain-containing protein [Kamptonema cortianum]|nr:PH domain-containing protein [Geitlerinema splendidum]MDK3158874.1 PH domain-containing protein [Kamptonema cortianum]